MALSQPTLRYRLRRFADVDHALFTGTPTSEDDARWRWATAFGVYAATIQAGTSTPGTTLVATAFHGTLRLARAIVAQQPTSDFAAAWRAGMLAITGIIGGSWDAAMLTLRETALRTTLKALFAAPTVNTGARLSAIAGAFHAATFGMKSATNVVYG